MGRMYAAAVAAQSQPGTEPLELVCARPNTTACPTVHSSATFSELRRRARENVTREPVSAPATRSLRVRFPRVACRVSDVPAAARSLLRSRRSGGIRVEERRDRAGLAFTLALQATLPTVEAQHEARRPGRGR